MIFDQTTLLGEKASFYLEEVLPRNLNAELLLFVWK